VLNYAWNVIGHANQYFTVEAPWAKAKTNPSRQGTILYVTAEALRQIGILIQPFVPSSAGKLLDQLSIPLGERAFDTLGGDHRIKPGVRLPPPKPVFPRYVETEATA